MSGWSASVGCRVHATKIQGIKRPFWSGWPQVTDLAALSIQSAENEAALSIQSTKDEVLTQS